MAVNTKWNKEDDEALEKAERISQLVSDLVLDKKDAVSEADALLKEIESKEKAKGKELASGALRKGKTKIWLLFTLYIGECMTQIAQLPMATLDDWTHYTSTLN